MRDRQTVNEKVASADDVQPPEAVDAEKDAAATKIQAGFTGMMVRQELEADSLEKQMEKPSEEDLSKGEEVAPDADELMIPRDPEQGRVFLHRRVKFQLRQQQY